MSENFLPENFVHLYQDQAFLKASFPNDLYKIVGDYGAIGRAYAVGPFQVEYYTTDKEPIVKPFLGLRIIFWNSITRTTLPTGWKMLRIENVLALTAFVDVSVKEYWKNWSETFRRYRRLWNKQNDYVIEKVSIDVYEEYYKKYAVDTIALATVLRTQQKHLSLEMNQLTLSILKRVHDGCVIAGIATVDCRSANQSYYLSAFTRKDIAPPATGLWLLSNWMDNTYDQGLRYCNLGMLWSQGMPKSWKGFSSFKNKFKPILLVFPKQFYKITFSIKTNF